MRLLLAVSMIALAVGCSGRKEAAKTPEATPEKPIVEAEAPKVDVAGHQRLETMRAQFARIDMAPDVSFLSEDDKKVVNLLNEAAGYMSQIYLRQKRDANPQLRAEIAASSIPDKALVLDLFDLNFGAYDEVDHQKPFYGSTPAPEGAGFYPEDMTKDEFDAWIAAHGEDKDAFMSPYTVIRREGEKLVAIPYSKYYAEFLEPAAGKLREAAAITSNESLKKFLTMRADAFQNDDYYASEMAWMDLDGPIEVAIGPYEVYTDNLYGMKTSFEAFVTVKDPAESAALAKYKNFLRDMEANLPVDDAYKNFKRGFESPIAVVSQVHGGGDNVPGIQTIAFNLPNDERVREAKGAKKVLLDNVMGAKFERILQPMAAKVLVADQAPLLMKKYMGAETLFHELSHSLGPGTITKNGAETTVNAELKELYSAVEEGKADVMGAYNILYMMKRGELPEAEKNNFLATYFTGVFRAMRFGIAEAHGRGAAYQYKYLMDKGAATWDDAEQRYRIDFAKLEQGVSDLVHDVVVIQGNGDYDAAKAFLETTAVLDDHATAVIASMTDLPVDIQPVYPERI